MSHIFVFLSGTQTFAAFFEALGKRRAAPTTLDVGDRVGHRAALDAVVAARGGADRTTTEVNKLLGQLPPAVQALTGVDLSGVSSYKCTLTFGS